MYSSTLLSSSYFLILPRPQQNKAVPNPRGHGFQFQSPNSSPCFGFPKNVFSKSTLSLSSPAFLPGDDFEVELGRLLALFPEGMRQRVGEHPELRHLIEIVMDLGRKPLARFPSGDFFLSDHPITTQDLEHATSKVLIEAVENHMPQVIVIDEIGTKLEAMAASTIAQRGIQLVATAHGVTIENLVMNPALEMLVGGVQSVTLGDEEASRRGVQKSVLERKGPSVFSCGVEIISKTELRVHRNLEATVDAILSGRHPSYEVRKINEISQEVRQRMTIQEFTDSRSETVIVGNEQLNSDLISKMDPSGGENVSKTEDALCLFLYGAFEFTDNISEADALLVLHSKLKKKSGIQAAARAQGLPTYISKTSSLSQITKAMQALAEDYADGFYLLESEARVKVSENMDALEEARIAIQQVVIPKGEPVELLPRPSNILLLQKDLISKYNLKSERIGTESEAHLRIIPFSSQEIGGSEFDSLMQPVTDCNGSPYTVDILPLLPE
ncbi:unnamed protein product [Cuscuta epithymum]|uniref:Phosphotyrosine protein phosphatase domain-containing protein n=1 Tax=Cuscuta epithymum TaxID=186058 RepID=A0AAV0FIW7_9ASTE|nr:unnamed protein product [Cuscuta epithymum]